jgi:hypothetical protein
VAVAITDKLSKCLTFVLNWAFVGANQIMVKASNTAMQAAAEIHSNRTSLLPQLRKIEPAIPTIAGRTTTGIAL